MALAIDFDWSENYDTDTGEETFDLTCPNREHHNKYGTGWHTEYESEEDLEGNKCTPYQGCPCCEDDGGYLAPMMNYYYKLDYKGFVDGEYDESKEGEKIRTRIASETSCICVENTKTGEWVITLTGGGMDLSPHIAYAFFLAQKWMPLDLLESLRAGWCKDSLSEKQFKELKKVIKEQLRNEIVKFREKSKQWSIPTMEITQ